MGASMKIRLRLFNSFLRFALILALSLSWGTLNAFCQVSPEDDSLTEQQKPLTDKEKRKISKERKAAEEARIKAEKKAEKERAKAQKKKEKEDRKKLSLVKFFLETPPSSQTKTQSVSVYRAFPEKIYIGTREFVDERDFKEVNLVDTEDGGFQIEFILTTEGATILQNITGRYRGRRIVIFANFGDPRYLGAPKIEKNITDGVVRITPDASREEAERFVLGMKNTIREVRRKDFGL